MIHFSESGTGHPIVLIHGYCENSKVWNVLSKQLSDEFRVLCPDLPGFGKSPELNNLTIPLVAEEIKKWLDQLDIEQCLMIGHSLGGYVTLAFAEQYPEKIEGFGLFHSTATSDTEERKKTRSAVKAFADKYGVPRFIDSLVPNLFRPDFPKTHPNEYKEFVKIALESEKHAVVDYAMAMAQRTDKQHILNKGIVPVLFIAGNLDSSVPVALSKEQALDRSGIEFHLLEESAHMGMYEEPERCYEIIRNFAQSIHST
jgi:pimeloyl-ACP methyl ester carboxylesterase